MTVTEEIKSRLDIVDLVSQSVKLRKTGKNYSGFCPFHSNTRTPAFVVFPDSGTWRCFGECNEGGDIFRFVMKKEGWDFPTTLRYLADKAGVQLAPVNPQQQVEEEEHARLRTLLEDAVTFYRHNLLQNPAGQAALEYIKKRGLTPESIETYGLGYAPNSWEAAIQYFNQKGYTNEELVQAGMVSERDSGGVYDRFRNRIMFPIRDATGKMAGFGARILDPNDVPKFINTAQTVLFDKGRLLYGLDQARKAIRAQDQAVIVEGYLDVIVVHQGGYPNVVSPMGTALTEDQLRLLKRFTRRIVLALDADAAGEKATLRGLDLARQALDHEGELVFDARGLLHNEARLQADVRVTTLPPGKDPDEVVLADPAEWGRILANAKPIVLHVMETLAASRDLNDPKEKSAVAAQVLPLIADVPNPVERDAYRQQLARLLKVDERALVGASQPQPRSHRRPANVERPQRRESAVLQATSASSAVDLEKHCLRLLLRLPDMVYKMDRSLQEAHLGRFSIQDFEQADNQTLARLILSSLEQEKMDPLEFIQSELPEDLAELAGELNQPLPEGEPGPERRVEDLIRTLLRLRLLRVNESINQLRYLQEDAQQQGEMRLNPYQEIILQYTQTRARLDQALARPVQAV
ncbi:MAG: DNA primase [Anaerolineaceae bacterium]|jgi:DNA primase